MNKQKAKQDSQFQNNLNEFGKVPPQAIDIEESVLGACMLERDAYSEIGHVLSPECFYKEANAKIFAAIEKLSANTEPVDILTVTNQLKTEGELEICGGPYKITMLTSRIASTANISYHAYIVYEKYIQRQMISKCSELINFAFEDTGFSEMETNYSRLTEEMDGLFAGKRASRSMKEIIPDYMKELDRRSSISKEGGMAGIPTGNVQLNKVTNGWKPGELIIVAGRPGMGKTAVALNYFAKNAAINGKRIQFFSLEMDEFSLTDRLTCSYGGINPDSLKSGQLSDGEWDKFYETAEELQKLPISIDDSAGVTIKHISAITRSSVRKGRCDMVVIDYLQLIDTSDNNAWNRNREREVAEMSRSLKLLAKELKIPVILLCQLSRAVETRQSTMKRPALSDLRESGAIEQDADIVIFPYRPEYYGILEDDSNNSLKGVGILIVAKNRQGRIGDVFFNYSEDLTQFFDFKYTDDNQPF